MGFREFRLFNQALLARQAWRILSNPDSLCAQVMKAKYFPSGLLVDTVFPSNSSPTWQAVAHGLELLKHGILWRVGNGQSIRILRDRWIPNGGSGKPITVQGRCRLRRVSELLDERGAWRMDLLQQYFNPVDVEQIVKIRTSPRLEEDVLAWEPERNGIFTVRSAYRLALDERLRPSSVAASRAPDGRRAVWAFLWRCPAPPKVRVFAWRVATNCLATWTNKHARSLEVSNLCPVCATEPEDTFHALCRCPHAVALWQAMARQWNIPDIRRVMHTGPEWLFHVLADLSPEERMYTLMTIWRCWHVRNEIVHDKRPPPVEASTRFLTSYINSLLAIQAYPHGDHIKGKMVAAPLYSRKLLSHVEHEKPSALGWEAPPAGWAALNIDGSFSAKDGTAGAGMVLRDEHGDIIFSSCRELRQCASPLESELAACSEGISLATQWSELLL